MISVLEQIVLKNQLFNIFENEISLKAVSEVTMKLKHVTFTLISLLLLASCGLDKSRFGEPMKNSNSNMPVEFPPLIKPALEETEAIELFEKTPLSTSKITDSQTIQQKWQKIIEALKADTAENKLKKSSMGTLYKLLEADKTGDRLPFLQIWFIEYGSKATMQDYPFLEKIVIERYLSRSDLDIIVTGLYLAGFATLTPEQLELLSKEDKTYKQKLDKIFLGK